MNSNKKYYCKDCGTSSCYHLQTWLDGFISCFSFQVKLSQKIENFVDLVLENFFIFFKLVKLRSDFGRSDIELRSTCFIDELKKHGASVKVLYGQGGFTNRFRVEMKGKIIRFDGLPTAEFASSRDLRIVDNKQKTKLHLAKGHFPITEGQLFWFWQKNQAVGFAVNKIGFPLVVKPCNGSVSRHVTTNIQNLDELKHAINHVVAYSPTFIVEKFIPKANVYRATVIDFEYVACVKQVRANIIGDGVSTIRNLIDQKNSNSHRGEVYQKEFTLYKIIENETTKKLLKEKKYTFHTVPEFGEIVYLQYNPFLKLGGDLEEVTPQIHPDNLKLFRQIAKFFDIRVVGMDFLAQDISKSYKEQLCAILELNSVPCIELHHFPSSGASQNVAKAMVDLFMKYYI